MSIQLEQSTWKQRGMLASMRNHDNHLVGSKERLVEKISISSVIQQICPPSLPGGRVDSGSSSYYSRGE